MSNEIGTLEQEIDHLKEELESKTAEFIDALVKEGVAKEVQELCRNPVANPIVQTEINRRVNMLIREFYDREDKILAGWVESMNCDDSDGMRKKMEIWRRGKAASMKLSYGNGQLT